MVNRPMSDAVATPGQSVCLSPYPTISPQKIRKKLKIKKKKKKTAPGCVCLSLPISLALSAARCTRASSLSRSLPLPFLSLSLARSPFCCCLSGRHGVCGLCFFWRCCCHNRSCFHQVFLWRNETNFCFLGGFFPDLMFLFSFLFFFLCCCCNGTYDVFAV